MKSPFKPFVLLFCLWVMGGCQPQKNGVVILTTNDIHAQIDRFPQLATAVERCRDTADVILVDAGDRWTGNAYVDLAEDRRPIIELMNDLGYDLAALGNHEFDGGQAMLERSAAFANFPILCGNVVCEEGATLRPFEASRILMRGGLRFGFTSVVTNYGPNHHPDGHDHIFEGLRFPDAMEVAAGAWEELAAQSDVTIALTHIGLDFDRQLAQMAPDYHLVIGGHSHDVVSERVGDVLLTQSGKNLQYVGAISVKRGASGQPELSHRLVSLDGYEPHPDYAERVAIYKQNPALQRPVGNLTAPASRIGLANLFAESVRRAANAEIGLYHYGGVRLDTLPAGEIPLLSIFNLDPFASCVSTLEMNTKELEALIITKFNDTVKPSESHCIDLFATVPYTVICDAQGEAERVLFPTLQPEERYRVAMGDYVFKTYRSVAGSGGVTTATLVTDALQATLAEGPYTPQNDSTQTIE